ncbi:MAG: HAMP domain-containing sensor histidine kinase [Jaaginema sp. PMC 1079.18]|nr:HAMP domain-containing sensor histidine kinase [Jaaginema sp. PMC 1080.18]MEC4853752.1 HAMP domain-containing sensor histidine kinase [Jaaginema sp. PMC 1079.18]MEC4869074.1 HAMP domain-containing sensor histidine kinase [Jaaginema sp. PMC 1078.18]
MDLDSHQFLSFFEPKQAAQLQVVAIIEQFRDRAVIFDEGAESDCIYLVLDGEVEFRKQISPDKYQSLAKAQPDAFFGELGLLDGKPRSMQAIALDSAILAKIPSEDLMQVLEQTKGTVVTKLCSYMIERLRSNTEEYVHELIRKEKMVLYGEMLNTVIHDFRSPLSSINLASSIIKDQHPNTDTVEWCELIAAQTQRMTAMAEEFLEFARGNTVMNEQPLDIAVLLQRLEKLNRIFWEQSQVELQIDCPSGIIISADEDKLLRVLQNLTTNAVDAFRGKGGRIEIKVMKQDNQAEITIRDNGPGIPESIQARLFDAFVTHGKANGTGLGTAIAKSIVDAHHGEIDFVSHPGQGTCFYLRFPSMPF